MGKTEYADKIILALRSKYREKQAEYLPADREIVLHGKRIALIVLGNFHCSFPQYDTWKPAVLKLLATVQKGGNKK